MNQESKRFVYTIAYLKYASLGGALMCFVLLFFRGFDPFHSLDGMIWKDMFGKPELPGDCVKAFELPFLLFTWLSVLSLIMLYVIAKYALPATQRWAFFCIVLLGVLWPAGAALITLYTGAWSYFVSVAMMTVLFLPPVILLWPFFKKTSTAPHH